MFGTLNEWGGPLASLPSLWLPVGPFLRMRRGRHRCTSPRQGSDAYPPPWLMAVTLLPPHGRSLAALEIPGLAYYESDGVVGGASQRRSSSRRVEPRHSSMSLISASLFPL